VSWLLGIDIGTSAVKAVVTNPTGGVLASASAPTPWRQERGLTEADPADLVAAVRAVSRNALSDAYRAGSGGRRAPGTGRVAGVGVTGIAESGVLIDDNDTACGPVIAWHDPRGEEQQAQLEASGLAGRMPLLTGQPVSRKLTAVKYRWLRDRLGHAAGAGRFLSVPEWVVLQFGGMPAPELSLWSRTGFLDIREPAFLADVADWAGLPWRDMPEPARAGSPAGHAGDLPGLPELSGAVLTVAGHDHVCAAYGAGVTDPRDICDSWGSGEAVIRGQRTLPDVRAALGARFSVSHHVIAGQWALFRGLGTGLLLRRILALLGPPADRRELDRLAADPGDLPQPRIDIGDDAIGVLNIPEEISQAGLWRAALLAAFGRVQDAVTEMEQICGPTRRVVGCGGWLRSEPLRRLKAGQVASFEAADAEEPAAVGAARLAGLAAGIPAPPEQRQGDHH
jgi:sugar (pentulose or hexulose) kinase